MTLKFKKMEQVKKILEQADAIMINSGAGMGVDSGLPDFRGTSGFWKAYPAVSELGISFSQMANPVWFEKDPELAWAFYGHRLNLYRQTVPHKGFKQLLEFGEQKKLGYFCFTSNVDGQFQKAGYDDDKIEEVHGSILHFQCSVPCSYDIWDVSDMEINVDMQKFKAEEPLPVCPKCGAIARPNILMFGDYSWLSQRAENQSVRFYNWLEKIENENAKLVIIEIGAGKAVPTVRHKSEAIAGRLNATLIRINPRDYDVPKGKHFGIAKGAVQGIELILSNL